MKNLIYDNADALVFLDYSSLAPATAATLAVYRSNSEELQAPTAVSVYTPTTLDAAASSGDVSFVLAAGSDSPSEGDLLLFANPREVCEVKSYDASSRTVSVREQLLYDRESGDDVYGASLRATVDTTSGYENGNHVILQWALDDEQVREIALVSSAKYDHSTVLRRLRVLYPTTFGLIEDDQDGFMREAEEMFESELQMSGIEIDSMPDSAQVDHLFLFYCRWLAVSRGGESWDQEQERAWENYLRTKERFVKQPQWQDKDFDNTKETGETKTGDSLPVGRAF